MPLDAPVCPRGPWREAEQPPEVRMARASAVIEANSVARKPGATPNRRERMPRNGHSGRCFRDRRRSARRMKRQGRTEMHGLIANAAAEAGLFGSVQAALNFSADKLQAFLRGFQALAPSREKLGKTETRIVQKLRQRFEGAKNKAAARGA